MKIFLHYFYLCLFTTLSCCGSLLAQHNNTFDVTRDDIQTRLPSLSVLLDSACAHDPYVHFRNQQIIVNKAKLNADRTNWTRNLGMQSDIRYGNYDNYSTNNSQGQPVGTIATTRTETKYGIGAYISFPVFDLLNRRNQITLAKTEVSQAESMVAMQLSEVRQKVIKQYNEMIVKQRIVQIRSKYLETSRMNMLMAEKEFINGVISVTEYARLSSICSQTETDFESAKMDFTTAYMLLEEIVGMKLKVNFNEP